MRQIKFFAIVFLVLVYEYSYSQTWESGWIKTSDGVKAEVEILYENWNKNPKTILIREGEIERSVGTEEIVGFFVSNEYYLGYVGKIVDQPKYERDLSFEKDIKFKEYDGFLMYLLKSDELNLLALKDSRSVEHFFVQEGANTPIELEYYRFKSKVNEVEQILQNERYKLQLSYFFSSCSKKAEILESIKYNQREMSKAFSAYFECVDNSKVYEKKSERLKFSFRPAIGMYLSTYKYQSAATGQEPLEDADYNQKLDPYFGLAMNFDIPRSAGNLKFDTELGLLFLNQEGQYTRQVPSFRDESTTSLQANYIRLSFGFNRLLTKSQSHSVDLGIGVINYFGKPDLTQNFKRINNQDEVTLETDGPIFESDQLRGVEQAIYLQTKAHFKKAGLFVRYEFGNGFSAMQSMSIKSQRLGFGVNYVL